eukprot:926843-Lingulodinium_polyedra.AAC.1
MLRAPPVEDLVRIARIAQLDRLLRGAPPYLLVLLDEAKGWLQAVEASLVRLAELVPSCQAAVGLSPRGRIGPWI